jgi:hypothetical protein
MSRYERGEPKISLEERGFKYSYGDDIEESSSYKKYFNSLSEEEKRDILKRMNEEE